MGDFMGNSSDRELIKKEFGISNRDKNSLRKRPFDRYEEKKKLKLIGDLSAQIYNVPQLMEQLSKGKEVALDISKEIASKIANGELEFIRKSKTGEAVGIIRDASSKKDVRTTANKRDAIRIRGINCNSRINDAVATNIAQT